MINLRRWRYTTTQTREHIYSKLLTSPHPNIWTVIRHMKDEKWRAVRQKRHVDRKEVITLVHRIKGRQRDKLIWRLKLQTIRRTDLRCVCPDHTTNKTTDTTTDRLSVCLSDLQSKHHSSQNVNFTRCLC
jgi:hypothetical protein